MKQKPYNKSKTSKENIPCYKLFWTDEEREIILSIAKKFKGKRLRLSDLQKVFPYRSTESIRAFCSRLGIKTTYINPNRNIDRKILAKIFNIKKIE